MRTASLSLDTIRLDGGTQCRAELHQDYIAGMAEAWSDGAKIPAVVVFHDGSAYWLADGFHRYHAAQKCDFRDIEAEIHSGTRTDAVRFALGANSAHGQPRTNADKRRAVEIALKEFPKLSNVELARICAVNDKTVAAARPASIGTSEPAKRTGADGKSYPATKPARPQPVDTPAPEPSKPAPREIVVPFVVPPQRSQVPQHQIEAATSGGKTSWALIYADMAIDQLNKITSTDPQRREALEKVSAWITQNNKTK